MSWVGPFQPAERRDERLLLNLSAVSNRQRLGALGADGPAQLSHHSPQQSHLFGAHRGALQEIPHLGHAGGGGVLQQETGLQQQVGGVIKTG